MYERYAGFNRYGDIAKFIADPDLLQITGDECVYISNEDDYDIAVDLETCYAPFDEVKPFIAFLATQICELDNIVQRFHRKKRVKNNGRGYVSLPSPAGTYRIDYSQSMEGRCHEKQIGLGTVARFQLGRLGEYKDVERTFRGNQTRRKKIRQRYQLRHFGGGSNNLHKSHQG